MFAAPPSTEAPGNDRGGLSPEARERLAELTQLQDRIRWDQPKQAGLARAGIADYTAEEWAELPWYGPISLLLKTPTITEIMVNAPHRPIRIDDKGVKLDTGISVHPEWVAFMQHQLIARAGILAPVLAEEWSLATGLDHPDARLRETGLIGTADNRLRFAATRPPATRQGASITLRVLPTSWLSLKDLVAQDVLHEYAAGMLTHAMRNGASVLVAGNTGAGKTTLIGALLRELAQEKRMVLIEEATELPEMPDAIPVEVLRSGQPFSYWVRFALRQKPDLIVVGEVRGPEALAMLQAASTGHPGICTIHAPDPQTALRNLERFAGQTGEMQPAMVRGLICSPSVQLVVAHIDRIDGKRRVGRIEEVTATGGAGGAGDRFTTNVLFTWERSGWKKGYPVEGAWGRNQW